MIHTFEHFADFRVEEGDTQIYTSCKPAGQEGDTKFIHHAGRPVGQDGDAEIYTSCRHVVHKGYTQILYHAC